MKKTKKTAITAAIFAAAMNLAACETDSYEKSKSEYEAPATEEYRPEDDEVYDVYGPPIAYEEEHTTVGEYKPEEEIQLPVYGPPECFNE
jgi:hypothetical protein rflaF_02283